VTFFTGIIIGVTIITIWARSSTFSFMFVFWSFTFSTPAERSTFDTISINFSTSSTFIGFSISPVSWWTGFDTFFEFLVFFINIKISWWNTIFTRFSIRTITSMTGIVTWETFIGSVIFIGSFWTFFDTHIHPEVSSTTTSGITVSIGTVGMTGLTVTVARRTDSTVIV
jgi:hypothetical protein